MKLLGGFICAFCEKKYSKADIVNCGEILYELDKFAIMEYQKDATDFKEYYSDDRNVICMPTKKEKNKMEIFIGSSSEAAKFMEDIAVKLESLGHKPLLWSDVGKGIFPANSNTIDALIAITERVDAAVFIFSADDKTWNDKFAIGDKKAVRDNVLLEYGLFVGSLGKDKVCLRLNWTTDENAPWSLKKIAEKRIEATLRKKYPQLPIADCWDIVADDSSAPKGLWQYICALTFSRPRDIIKLLKYCSQDMKGNKLTLSEVQSVEDKYSDWFYREFRDEAQSFLSCWKGALNCISEIAQGKDKVEKLEFKLSENSEVKEWCKSNNKTVMDVIKILFNYSVIGCINEKGRWIFKYKDEYFEFMTSYPDYCVHYGFCRKLRIPKSYDKIVLDANRQYK